MDIKRVRITNESRLVQGVRIALGLLFVMTGAMKLFVPLLATAWAGQLEAANIPLRELNIWLVPIIELAVGLALYVGFYTRILSLLVINIMVVATYVHLVVHDPTLFPLQPTQPVIPVVVVILSVYLLVKGGGSGSYDLNTSDRAAS